MTEKFERFMRLQNLWIYGFRSLLQLCMNQASLLTVTTNHFYAFYKVGVNISFSSSSSSFMGFVLRLHSKSVLHTVKKQFRTSITFIARIFHPLLLGELLLPSERGKLPVEQSRSPNGFLSGNLIFWITQTHYCTLTQKELMVAFYDSAGH